MNIQIGNLAFGFVLKEEEIRQFEFLYYILIFQFSVKIKEDGVICKRETVIVTDIYGAN